MAIDLTYETLVRVEADAEGDQIDWVEKQRHFNTDHEGVKNIIPQGDKVAVHLDGQTIMVPFNRVLELRVDLDPETVEKIDETTQEG